jgi:hypothetical protein
MAIFNYLRELTQITRKQNSRRRWLMKTSPILPPHRLRLIIVPKIFAPRQTNQRISFCTIKHQNLSLNLHRHDRIEVSAVYQTLPAAHTPSLLLITACHTVHWQV